MSFPVQVTFQGLDASNGLHAHVIEHAQRLERFAADVRACHVVIAAASRRRQQGNVCDVHVTLALAGEQIAAGGRAVADDRHADPYLAVTDTFEALRRRLEDRARKRRDSARTPATTR